MQILFNCKIKTWDVENHLKHNHFIIALNITSWIEKKKKVYFFKQYVLDYLFLFYRLLYLLLLYRKKKKSDMTGPVILVKRAGNEKHRAS